MDKNFFYNTYRDNRGASDIAPMFNNQEPLCLFLESSGYNPTVKFKVNVLTMRLLLAQDSLSELKDYEAHLIRQRGPHEVQHFATSTASGVSNTVLYPTDGMAGEVIITETIRVHQYFYSFCSFSVSVLDRIANEVNEIYGLRIKRVDWGKICDPKILPQLRTKNPELVSAMEKINGSVLTERLFDYRNVMEHDGVVEIAEFPSAGVFQIDGSHKIKLQDDPRDQKSAVSTPLIDFSRELFAHVVKSCDEIYGAIL